MLLYEEINPEAIDDAIELTDEELEAIAGGAKIKITAPESVNVRKHPSLKSRIIGYLNHGDKVTYDGATQYDDRGVLWYRVRFNNTIGWVSSKYSKKVKK